MRSEEVTLEQLVERGLDKSVASEMLRRVNSLLSSLSASECWRKIVQEILTPDHPFEVHKFLHEIVFSDWEKARATPPAWLPSGKEIQATNIARLMRVLNLSSYEEFHSWSAQNRADFWSLMIQRLGIRFRREFTKVVDLSRGAEFPQWFPDAKLNIADSCFNAPDDAPAIVFQPEEGSGWGSRGLAQPKGDILVSGGKVGVCEAKGDSGVLRTITYKALNSLANRVANALTDAGFNPGDCIAIDMPMTAESVAIYLGIIKAGCVVVSIADSFAPHEIEIRLRLTNAKAAFTQDYIPRAGKILPLYGKVISANAPKAIVLPMNASTVSIQMRDGDLTWEQFLSDKDEFSSVSRHPHDHMNVLFSSGTTGEPKAIPWTQTTPIRCAADGCLHHNIQPGDVVAWPTNIGWMMGPWLIYASLINQATIALYYGTPTDRGFGRFVQDSRVNMLGVVPSLVRIWRSTECMRGLDWSVIKAFSSTGECSNSEDMLFLMSLAGYRPIIEYCGGTEIGGGYITGTVVQPATPATFTTPALGLDFAILDENGQPTDNGEVFLIPPSIGLSTELLNKDHHQVYFEGTPESPHGVPLRRHGDQVERLGGGYYRIHGRVDDTMNLGGIKVSSAEIEQTLNSVSGVSETAAIAVSPVDGGPSQLVIYVVLLPGTDVTTEELKASLQAAIRRNLNPLFKIHDVVIVAELPRTASNKVMRRVLRDRYCQA